MINKTTAEGATQTFQLYNGEVTLTFKESGHRYTIADRAIGVSDQEVVGVTTILSKVIAKEALVNWAVKMTADKMIASFRAGHPYTADEIIAMVDDCKKAHRMAKEGAADIGTRAHKWIEEYIKAKINKTMLPEAPLEPDMREPIEAFLGWEKANKVTFEASERPVYSRKYGYCGTVDFIAIVNGIRILGDIKTSNAIYPESYYLQVAGYRYAYEEENPEANIFGMTIIRIPKDKKSQLEVKQVNDYEDNATAFIYAVHLYRQITKLKNFNK